MSKHRHGFSCFIDIGKYTRQILEVHLIIKDAVQDDFFSIYYKFTGKD